MENNKVLAVDAGTVRVGLAISDETRTFAFPLNVIPAPDALAHIRDLVARENVGLVVVGIPYTLRGEKGPEARRVEGFIGRLRSAIKPIPVETADERLSSLAADQAIGTKRGRDKRDAVAAAIILKTWMERSRVPPPAS